jgi:hypothetical protein
MKQRTWLVVVAVALVAATAARAQSGAAARASAAVKEIAADLREARDLLKMPPDKSKRERMELLLTRAELKAGDVQKELAALGTAPRLQAVSADEFAKVLKAVKAPPFDDAKLSVVEALALGRYYTCAQVKDMLRSFAFDDGRVKAAVALYPQVTDQANFGSVLDAFAFEANRKAVRDKLKLR